MAKLKTRHVLAGLVVFGLLIYFAYPLMLTTSFNYNSGAVWTITTSPSTYSIPPGESRTFTFTWGEGAPNAQLYRGKYAYPGMPTPGEPYHIGLRDLTVGGVHHMNLSDGMFDISFQLNGNPIPYRLENNKAGFGGRITFAEWDARIPITSPMVSGILAPCCGTWRTQSITVTNNEDYTIAFERIELLANHGAGYWCAEAEGKWDGDLHTPSLCVIPEHSQPDSGFCWMDDQCASGHCNHLGFSPPKCCTKFDHKICGLAYVGGTDSFCVLYEAIDTSVCPEFVTPTRPNQCVCLASAKEECTSRDPIDSRCVSWVVYKYPKCYEWKSSKCVDWQQVGGGTVPVSMWADSCDYSDERNDIIEKCSYCANGVCGGQVTTSTILLPTTTITSQTTTILSCDATYAPVCGKDDITYGNECLLQKNNIELDYYKACTSSFLLRIINKLLTIIRGILT